MQVVLGVDENGLIVLHDGQGVGDEMLDRYHG